MFRAENKDNNNTQTSEVKVLQQKLVIIGGLHCLQIRFCVAIFVPVNYNILNKNNYKSHIFDLKHRYMYRLIIVGNGFDLAHGLPTGYHHFIDWYWRDVCGKIVALQVNQYVDNLIAIQLLVKQFDWPEALKDFTGVKDYISLKKFTEYYSEAYQPQDAEISNRCFIKFENSFFRIICDRHSIQNWVDIENEYYKLLKDCLKEEDNSKVKRLNEEFEQVKQLLERYLIEEVDNKFNFTRTNNRELLDIFEVKHRNFDGDHLDFDYKYLEEFPRKHHDEIIEVNKLIGGYHNDLLKFKVLQEIPGQENLFLNFNYTHSLDGYIKYLRGGIDLRPFGTSHQIHIHGRLNDPKNKINFGFGDEMDKHYSEIEEKDDNEYLKYIKSFQYLENSNYKRVLDFIERDIFQVYIMGHSCGLSDRILLNTIFEHTNCVSIKVFYYKNGDCDNYTEIVQNISRHFNKKKLMRDKIVNKSLCQPLPQKIRFEAWNPPSGY